MEQKPTNAADRATIERIVAQWRERAEKIGTLHCVAEGKATAAKGCYNGSKHIPQEIEGDVPAEDYSFTLRYDWLFDFKQARFRIEKRGEVFHTQKVIYVPSETVTAFDGARQPRTLARREWNTTDSYAPPPNQPEFYVELSGPVLNTPDLVGLLAHGAVPSHGVPIRPAGVGSALSTPSDFILHGRAERGGRGCVVLRSVGRPPTLFTEYWVDDGRQGAIVHWENRAPKRKIFEFDIDYQEVGGLWVPKTIDYTKYASRPENPPELFCRLHVTRIEPNAPVPDDLFVLEPERGMLVWNATTSEPYRAGEEAASAPRTHWAYPGFIALIAAALGGLWLRRRSRDGRCTRVVVREPP